MAELNSIDIMDKSKWGEGPWQTEPDRLEFKAHGFDCLLNRSRMGNWCGYVAVKPGHPLFEVGYDACSQKPICKDAEENHYCDHSPSHYAHVHGGLTYADHCQGSICHVPAPGEPDNVWWFGFDCAHGGDVIPSMNEHIPKGITSMTSASPWGETYKDLAYVRDQTEHLAEQLSEFSPVFAHPSAGESN